MFDQTQTVVYDLMKADPFRRFLASRIYAEFRATEPASKHEETSKTSIVDKAKSFIHKKTKSLQGGASSVEMLGEDKGSRASAAERSAAERGVVEVDRMSQAE